MNLSSEVLPNGKLYYNIAKKVVDPMMVNNFLLISEVSQEVQTVLNQSAGLGMRGLKPEINQDRIDGIVQRLALEESFDDIKWILGEPVINFSQSVVDDTIKTNAQFHYDAGLKPKIIRTANANCCDWCDEVAGVYDYKNVMDTGNDVYRRHRYCQCEVNYLPGDGRRQNAHSKTWT
ncbi:hypothetical protein [Facklamia sp. 7083-14-GEN3]|uniref:hypothetical protein n=1 Tax=Facklamia sp. 7083-14-GEN3 TaxID=2973478 RepID=UPI00215D361E|nr:hypothetical protein [Facklamia sp. 7083-14-GEN3]MCR8969284.1 hypothetical protein [Facklamia sp. 7083-14-GEN3]